MQKEVIMSAGIDIGTSTTKMVLSELEIENTAGFGSVPRIEITSKRIVHRSQVYRTPLLDSERIDMLAIHELILQEYDAANIAPEHIQTGAILITGETATKKNASEVIHTLADIAGDFLVATAGADLEGVLAAKGSGAYLYSAVHPSKVVANIDIGGGTANIAVMQNKQLLGTCTLHIGGRLVEFSPNGLQVAPPIKRWLAEKGLTENTSFTELLLAEMVDVLKQALTRTIHAYHPLLLGHVPNWTQQVDTLIFSGGVSQFFRSECDWQQDIGEMIANVIQASELFTAFTIAEPEETVAATVIGTSTQTTEVSGATIHLVANDLPLKNCPLVTIDCQKQLTSIEEDVRRAVLRANELYCLQEERVAWYVKNIPYLSFRDVEYVADVFISVFREVCLQGPCIFIFEEDYGKVFGQTFLRKSPQLSVLSIDQIAVEQGDYIDIGRKLTSGVVPIVVKTLAFHRK